MPEATRVLIIDDDAVTRLLVDGERHRVAAVVTQAGGVDTTALIIGDFSNGNDAVILKDKDKLAEVIGQYDGLAIRSATKVSPKILENAKNLKVIGRAGIGVDNVDIPAATARGIVVMNTPFGNSITTAEHALALTLAAVVGWLVSLFAVWFAARPHN